MKPVDFSGLPRREREKVARARRQLRRELVFVAGYHNRMLPFQGWGASIWDRCSAARVLGVGIPRSLKQRFDAEMRARREYAKRAFAEIYERRAKA